MINLLDNNCEITGANSVNTEIAEGEVNTVSSSNFAMDDFRRLGQYIKTNFRKVM